MHPHHTRIILQLQSRILRARGGMFPQAHGRPIIRRSTSRFKIRTPRCRIATLCPPPHLRWILCMANRRRGLRPQALRTIHYLLLLLRMSPRISIHPQLSRNPLYRSGRHRVPLLSRLPWLAWVDSNSRSSSNKKRLALRLRPLADFLQQVPSGYRLDDLIIPTRPPIDQSG